MFAGFQVDNTLEVKKKMIDVDLTIDTQFASGRAALAVARQPKIVAQIVNPTKLTYSSSDSTMQLKAWLLPPGTSGSKKRATALQAWLKIVTRTNSFCRRISSTTMRRANSRRAVGWRSRTPR